MKNIDQKELYEIVLNFKKAIEKAQENRIFGNHSIMKYFPNGCCEVASDLLAHHLLNEHKINTSHYNGLYDGDSENIFNHDWLKYKNWIIDITYSQFRFITRSDEEIYVGIDNHFFLSFKEIHIVDAYDITLNEQMWEDYKTICKFL